MALIYIAPHFSEPKFIIYNTTKQTIEVTAEWRDTKKKLGKLQAETSTEFNVRDEAAMKIIASFPHGNEISHQPVYFTSGMVYIFEVYDNEIKNSFE